MTNTAAPKWFGIVSAIALVWNLLGLMAYVQQVTMSPETLAALPEAQRILMENVPSWSTAAFALSVNAGVLGCLALLLKKAWAMPLFLVSLVSVLVQMFYAFFMSNSYEVFGPGGMIMPIMVMAIAIYLVVLSRQAKASGWIS
jgi:hypothetical protein